jgi:hypothetical protein
MTFLGEPGWFVFPMARREVWLCTLVISSTASELNDDMLTSKTITWIGQDDGPLPSIVKIRRRPFADVKSTLKSTTLVLDVLP